MWSKIKDFLKDIPNNVWTYITIIVVAILMVIWLCGIKGNNDQNFWRKGDAVTEITSPRKPNPTKETPPRKGLNIVKGKVVIKTA